MPEVPFDIHFVHHGSQRDGVCVDVQPADDVLLGAFRLCVENAYPPVMAGDRVSLLNGRGKECSVTCQNAAQSMGGECFIEFIAVIPNGWFD